MASKAKEGLGVEKLDAIADRGYFDSQEILACEQAGVTVTLPKPMTSEAKANGRFGKEDFVYCADKGGSRQSSAPVLDDGVQEVSAEISV